MRKQHDRIDATTEVEALTDAQLHAVCGGATCVGSKYTKVTLVLRKSAGND